MSPVNSDTLFRSRLESAYSVSVHHATIVPTFIDEHHQRNRKPQEESLHGHHLSDY